MHERDIHVSCKLNFISAFKIFIV